MYPSLLFHNLTDDELDLYLNILKSYPEEFSMEWHIETSGEHSRDLLIQLVSKKFIIRSENKFRLTTPKELVSLILNQEYRFITQNLASEDDNNYLVQIKNYLASVQKQLAHVETESRKAFLNLRQMVDKISDQGKDLLNLAFNKALDRNTETGAWVSIPHISPVGLYEPIEELKHTFRGIINELELSLKQLVKEYHDFTLTTIEEKSADEVKQALVNKQEQLLSETKSFNEEVLLALNEQVNLLEKNLGKDLMEQFDAIERLNDLKPERVWIMLEETRSELNVYINSLYSRILREINTLQINVDISKVSLILTNEAGKAIKKVEQIQRNSIQNLRPIKELLDELE